MSETEQHAHCWHPAGPPYAVQDADGAVPGIVEICCHDGLARVKILRERPANAEGHGEYCAFVSPKALANKPIRPTLLVPGHPRAIH